MKHRIYYDPGTEGGSGGGAGGNGTPSPASPPAPSGAAPSDGGSGGSDPAMNFALQLRQIASAKTANTSQPASDGNETGGQAGPPEGDGRGNEAADPGTTADGEGLTGSEGKGAENKWSPDEEAYLEAHGLKGLAYTSEAAKLVKSSRELRSQFDRVSQSNTNQTEEVENMRRAAYALANGDLESFQKTFGVDLMLDRRTPDDRIKEIETDSKEFKTAFEKLLNRYSKEGNEAAAHAVVEAWQGLLGVLEGRAKVFEDEKTWKQREAEFLAKAGKAPNPKDAYKSLSDAAEKNLAMLAQEDKDAPLYFKAIEKETQNGGALRALGLDLSRIYGQSPAAARWFSKAAKALATLDNMPKILADERRRAEADFERKRTQGGPRGSTTGASTRGAGNQNPVIANLQAAMSGSARR
jgi:hypothetical protein